jgi:hypothetical protein
VAHIKHGLCVGEKRNYLTGSCWWHISMIDFAIFTLF